MTTLGSCGTCALSTCPLQRVSFYIYYIGTITTLRGWDTQDISSQQDLPTDPIPAPKASIVITL